MPGELLSHDGPSEPPPAAATSSCDVDVVAMGTEQTITDPGPLPLAPRPGAEELDWIAVWLAPAPVDLGCLVQAPAKTRRPVAGEQRPGGEVDGGSGTLNCGS